MLQRVHMITCMVVASQPLEGLAGVGTWCLSRGASTVRAGLGRAPRRLGFLTIGLKLTAVGQ